MSEPRDARHMLEMAERAAIDGDLSSADELLRSAAQIQEATLGPLHPDLANTLNNLAVVAEKTGRLGDAETFYRRAAAIAAASLPPDDPLVAESRKNLEDFCRERGVPIATPTVAPSSPDTAPRPAPIAAPTDSQPLPPAARRSPRHLEWIAVGAIVLVTVAALARRPWSSRETSTVPAASQVKEPAPAEPPLAPPATPAPIERVQPPTAAPRAETQAAADKPSAPARPSGAISLSSVQLCQTFSTSGGSWRCDPPGDSVVPGRRIVLYTRVRSTRDTTVVHRWYREGILRQAVKLTIRANALEGYRTYSRQAVEEAGDWRVEVMSAEGNLLHEQRFAAR